ncbi:PAS domain S-box protein [Agrobacterium rubi]|uniref:ATP-binding protein n=1 Tax=Agrobacterium rubi TaxID=28099 RepID=UPI00157244AA|nr:ATP-binding protein [Agrobacterium rubi]NTF06513.1 PAS domain S-box protein [Agrobacterium rubi]NTF18755.1 PAS domain S-box protein [Agrobacterium rubi]NTF25718.1 PAS domain S-box protein [Agrobacterium rubi]
MPAVQYPFIDIAVHERVREHFGRGEAMALFSMDLQNTLWANGRGAALFGTPMIYDFLERGPKPQDVTFRQLAATAARLTQTGDSKSFTIRIHSGFKSVSIIATAEIIEAEAGQQAILFSAPIDQMTPSLEERARRMIEGFDDPDIHMAVLDADSKIVAASPGFSALGITSGTTRTLISMASTQVGKLVKRPVPAGKGYLPAAVGQLSKEPDLNLLFVVETVIGTLDPSSEFTEAKADVQPLTPVVEAAPVLDEVREPIAQDFEEVLESVAQIEEITEPQDVSDDIDVVTEPDVVEDVTAAVGPEPEVEPAVAVEPADEPVVVAEAAQPDDTTDTVLPLFAQDTTDVTAPDEVIAEAPEFEEPPVTELQSIEDKGFVFEPNRRASRFVWKIDATGHFTSISHEFADAVGPKAANVEGMSFADLAALFNLDPDGKIAELLNRRDTWSGKTIYWPVEGTSLTVPIDLAALPTYTRSREFDGFRGFGIVRLADAVEDPNAVGLSLVDDAQPELDSVDVAEDDTVDESVLFSLPANDDEADAEDNAPRSYEPPDIEVPVLKITETPNRRYSDKVVQLEERRSRGREELSASEQAAFQEIARTLKPVAEEAMDVPGADEAQRQDVIEIVETSEPELAHPHVADTDEAAEEPQDVAAPLPPESDDDFAAYTRGDEPVSFLLPQPSARNADNDHDDETGSERPGPLRHGASLTADAVDQMPIALLIHSGDRLIHANPEFLRLTGYGDVSELAEVGGLDALLQRDELDAMTDHAGGMMAVSAENDLIPVRARLQSVRWEEASALMLSLIPNEEKSAAPLPANENIQADSAETDIEMSGLKGQVEELHSILETATDGVVLLDEDGSIRSLNRSASALFNYDNDEVTAKPFVTLFAHESQRAVLDYLSGLANNGVASVLNDGREVIGREASGGFLPLFMTIGRLKSSNGYCAVIRDITQWKRTEEDLRNAKRAAETANAHKTDFLARVSHEIRTPLNAIIGFADMMATERFGPVGNPRYIEYSNDIVRSGRHVLDIVNDLLDISKIEAGQMDVEFKAVALNDTIAEAVSIVQPQANNQRVIIRTALSPSVPQIVADLRSIKQIMLNILSNAIKFTPSGGQIVVSTAYETNGSVSLRIRDTGIGMTRSELEHAMKPFRQVSASSSRVRGDGTGLGLPLTKAMVDANRANFSITSTPNEGTLVEISFPSQRVLAN